MKALDSAATGTSIVLLTLRQYDENIIQRKLAELGELISEKIKFQIALDIRSNDSFNSGQKVIRLIEGTEISIVKGTHPGKSNAQRTASESNQDIRNYLLIDSECKILCPDWSEFAKIISTTSSAVIGFPVSFPGRTGRSSFYFIMENWLRSVESKWNCMFTTSGQLMLVSESILKKLPDDVGDDCFCGLYAQLLGYKCQYSSLAKGLDKSYKKNIDIFWARRRMAIRNLPYTLFVFLQLVPKRPRLALLIFLHKLLRWLLPMIAIATAATISILHPVAFPCIMSMLLVSLLLLRNLIYGSIGITLGVLESILLNKRISYY